VNEMRRDRVSTFYAGIAPHGGSGCHTKLHSRYRAYKLISKAYHSRKSYMRGHIKVTLTIALH